LVSGDFALFMAPEFRGSSTAYRFVKEYVEWAKGKGVEDKNIGLGISTGVHTEATKRLYEKNGFEVTGLSMNFRGAA
jgi:GNAT superfamily N-acetyltransferase